MLAARILLAFISECKMGSIRLKMLLSFLLYSLVQGTIEGEIV